MLPRGMARDAAILTQDSGGCMADFSERVFGAVVRATERLDEASDESALQSAIADTLGSCSRELRASFAPPARSPKKPPPSAILELASRTPPRRLSPEGRDPCSSAARLDLLW